MNAPQDKSKAEDRTRVGPDHRFDELEQLRPGTRIRERYELRELLGRGGFGVVFAARDRILRSDVAIKFLHPRLSRSAKDFRRVRREINLSRLITDSRIVKIFSLESWRGLYFLVMERVLGRPMSEYLGEKGAVSWQELQPIFLDILAGVRALHSRGIVHRDLKPANIIMQDGNVKILDFGMAKAIDDTEQTAEIGEIVGSPRYMSPEQVRGARVGCASDIYQLGLILYRALSGHHPFSDSANTMEMMINHLETEPPRLDLPAGRNPRFLQDMVSRALEKNPRRRFADVAEMIEALRRGRVRRLGLRRRLNRRLVRAAVLVLAGLAGLVWALRPLRMTGVDVTSRAVVRGVNSLGIPLWKRDFAPSTVYRAATFNLKKAVPESWTAAPGGHTGVRAVVVPPQNRAFPADWSLGTLAADSRLVLLDSGGGELWNECFSNAFRLDSHGYSRRFYAYRAGSSDLNGDGVAEQIFLIRQSQSMFPSALLLLREGGFSVFTCPGVISRYRVVGRDPGHVVFQIVAMDNPLAHMRYLARVRLNLKGGRQFLQALPNLTEVRTAGEGGQQVLLPPGARVQREGPGERLTLRDRDSGDLLEWRDGILSVEGESGGVKEYRDSAEDVARALYAVQRAYISRLSRHDIPEARRELGRAFDGPLKNPYMVSALLYLRGDLKAEAGEYSPATEDLESALRAYAFNMDAACRLCETEFLRGRTDEAERLVTRRFGSHFMFWGLSNGRRLFLVWIDLHRGRFRDAREKINALMFDKPELGHVYGGLVDLFAGRYGRAADAFTAVSTLPPHLFTLAESRLFLARALTMAGRDPRRAQFLLRDLKTYSIRQGWRAAEIEALLTARRGEKSLELARRAREAWRLIRSRSRGDFQARLWLFLDAWCYGRTMEYLGDTDAARDGYRACIAANPHTGAAADARTRLARLTR